MEDNRKSELVLNDALDLFVQEEYEICLNAIKRYADENSPEACSKLGLAFQLGLGVSIDFDKAIYYLTKAADLSSGEAAHNLATLYATMPEKNIEKARHWFKQARKLGFDPSTESLN